jgi:hypothetical protein
MRLKHFVVAMVASATFALMPSIARADSLSLVLNPVVYNGQSGGSVTLMGTFTNGAGAILWNGFQLNSSPAGLTDAAVQPRVYFSGGLASLQALVNSPSSPSTLMLASPTALCFRLAVIL